MPRDPERASVRLHDVLVMHSYYGTVSWQILGISLAAATIIATLPFISPVSTLGRKFGMGNEIFAMGLTFFGSLFWAHNQGLANKWKNCRAPYRAAIDRIERRRFTESTSFSARIGLVLAAGMISMVLFYVMFVSFFVINLTP